MFKLRPAAMILGSIALLLASVSVTTAQDDSVVVISVGSITVDACSGKLNLPIYMQTPYAVGGFNFTLSCTEPWLFFALGTDLQNGRVNWDTVGSIISNWQAVGSNVPSDARGTIRITAIADMPGGQEGIYLPPGSDGLLMTLHPKLSYDICADTSQLVEFDTAGVADTSGYILWPYSLVSDSVYLLPGPCAGNPRGDANCSGMTNGIDVVYLVSFFKGRGASYCCLCSGDANNSDSVNGIDVTYLVAYLRGGPAPVPCD